MYLSCVTPNIPERVMHKFKNEYSVHQLVWEWFSESKDQNRNFLYRIESGSKFCIYTLSDTAPRVDTELFHVISKEFNYMPKEGDRLSFLVRVNPVVSLTVSDQKRGKRHDVVMAEKTRRKISNDPISNAEIEYCSILNWIEKRSGNCGFELNRNSFIVKKYARNVLYKRTQSKPIILGTADIEGTLRVTQSDQFINTIKNGLGSAKGFGCGLILLKPT